MIVTAAPPARPKDRHQVAPEIWLAGAVASPGQPLSQQVYAHMRRAIIEGRLEPGGTIDEPAVAHHFGVSRTPVREALLRLRQDGLVEIRRQAGTFVAPIDRTRVEEGMIAREALEPRALEIACSRTDQRTLDDLAALTDRMAAATEREDGRAFIDADDRFHRALLDASGYIHIAEIIDQVNAQLDRVRHLSVAAPDRARSAVLEHRQIIDRITAGDAAGAAKSLRHHLKGSWAVIRTILDTLHAGSKG